MKRAIGTMWAAWLLVSACNAETTDRVCAPGASAPCTGPEGCSGYQVCREDGSGFEPCDCTGDLKGQRSNTQDAGADAGGTDVSGADAADALPSLGGVMNLGAGGAPGADGGAAAGGRAIEGTGGSDPLGTGGGANAAGGIGTPCTDDTDCPGEGTYCIAQTATSLLGGGPQGGICVADCTTNVDCAGLDPPSVCVAIGEADDSTAVCLPECFLGPSSHAEVKCLGRPELACYGDFCGPTCENDAACAPRVCDLARGVCVEPAMRRTDGQPLGSACDPNAQEDPCNGFCLTVGDVSLCSGLCNVSTFGCGSDSSGPGPFESACLYAEATANLGDSGFCGQLCDCDDDCHHPDAVCEAVDGSFASASGRRGACAIGGGATGIPCGRTPDAGTARDGN